MATDRMKARARLAPVVCFAGIALAVIGHYAHSSALRAIGTVVAALGLASFVVLAYLVGKEQRSHR